MTTRPAGSRRATITPSAPVRVSRSPSFQPSVPMTVRSPTRPESSIRPNPYTTSSGRDGIRGVAASGSRRTGRAPPPARAAGRAREGMTGAMSCGAAAASLEGETAPTRAAGPRVRVMSVLQEISPVWVSEGGLEPGNRCDFPGSGKSCNKGNTFGASVRGYPAACSLFTHCLAYCGFTAGMSHLLPQVGLRGRIRAAFRDERSDAPAQVAGHPVRCGSHPVSCGSADLMCGLLTVGGGYAAQVTSVAPLDLDVAVLLDWGSRHGDP